MEEGMERLDRFTEYVLDNQQVAGRTEVMNDYSHRLRLRSLVPLSGGNIAGSSPRLPLESGTRRSVALQLDPLSLL